MPAAIPIAAAVIGAVGANMAANKQSKAAQAAADTTSRQAELDRQQQLELYQLQRADQAPYREAGYRTLSQIMSGIQPGGEFDKRFDASTFQQDPGYAFRLEQGQKALDRAAAATGNMYSGAQLKALAGYNSGQASQEYNNAYNRFTNDQGMRYNRLASVAGLGQTALGQTQAAGTSAYGNIAQIGANSASSIGRSLQDAAEARASGYVGTANALGSGLRSLYNNNAFDSGGSSFLSPTQGGFADLNSNAMGQTENFNLYGSGYSP